MQPEGLRSHRADAGISPLRKRRAPVAQLDRASASGAEGRRFESCQAHFDATVDGEFVSGAGLLQSVLCARSTAYRLARYEMALVYADMGDREKALEHLQVALDIWKDADPEFKPLQEARQKLAELSSAP